MVNYRNYWVFVVLASVFVSFSGCLNSQSPPPQKLTASEQNELQTLTMQLTDSDRLQKTHVDAARMLLQKPYPQAGQTLLRWLKDSSNPGTQNAIAAAIVQESAPREEFEKPLLKMLVGKEPSVRSAAALGLVTYKNGGVIDKLIKIAANTKLDRDVRLTTIDAMQWSGSRRCVETLIKLLGDHDRAIRDAAGKSLAAITNIRTLGTSRGAWARWWNKNRKKTRIQWLSELTDSLTHSVMVLEKDNAVLRKRLVRSITELYNASPKTQQTPMILEFLGDPLDDVRLLGLTLTGNMLADNEKIPAVLRQKVATMFNDPSPSVRQATAVLEANLGGPEIVETLLVRLKNEPVPEVRVGILNALGQLKSPAALDAVLSNIKSKDATEATAATEAFSKIVAAQPLTGKSQTNAADVLNQRYKIAIAGKNHSALREALLTAMATLGDASCTETLVTALQDPSGIIRLAAVNGLAQTNGKTNGRAVKAEKIAPLCNDDDRGVRQGAIAALGKLNAHRHVGVILKRTNPQIEPNATVRKEAMQTVYSLLEQADSDTLKNTLVDLDNSEATEPLRIKIMQLHVAALKKEKAPTTVLVSGLMKLATQLRKTGRTDEAVTAMSEAYTLVQANGKNFPAQQISNVWFAYLEAMLLGNDPGAIELMGKQTDKVVFARSLKMLRSQLLKLTTNKQYLPIISMVTRAQQELDKRLDEGYKTFLATTLKQAKTQQELIDSDTVAKLTPLLIAPSETESAAAQTQLKGMASRAIKPLAMQLEATVSNEEENPKLEKAIYDLLRQLAPNFGPYDLTADKTQRQKQIRAILEKL
ncbi:MAG: HEAT repeat domain-containing protein [Phycisphaerae bacterium]|nr:HEAT repeat domain-containing protein [Phycisphaerae bacterium]